MGTVGHRATGGRPVVCPVVLTMECATTGQKMEQAIQLLLNGWSKKRRHDGTTGHLEVDTPRATVPSLSTCDGHTTGHRPVALF